MQRYTTMSVFKLSAGWAGAVISASLFFCLSIFSSFYLSTFFARARTPSRQPARCRRYISACNVEQVDHGDNEHPDQVDEMPVQGPDFDVVGLVTAAFVAESHDRQGDHAADHVSQV